MRIVMHILLGIGWLTTMAVAETPVRRPWLDPNTGQPFFPLGWYDWEDAVVGGPSGRPSLENAKRVLDQLAQMNANTIVFNSSWCSSEPGEKHRANIDLMREYLDHAETQGIKVLVSLSGVPSAFMGEGTARIEALREVVQALQDRPALWGYVTYDEPEFRLRAEGEGVEEENRRFIQALTEARRAIRQWDENPHRLVHLTFNIVPPIDSRDWRRFLPACEAIQIDRYPINRQFDFFPRGDWGAVRCAWQIAHGVASIAELPHRNPAIVMQGVGKSYFEGGYHWRDPTYHETRYMAYSSLTAGSWGVFHWILRVSSKPIRQNVARLYAELRQLIPALETSWTRPAFAVDHDHKGITRDWLTDRVADITTLELEDEQNYYLVAVNNSRVLEEITFRLKLPHLQGTQPRLPHVLNEDWPRGGYANRMMRFDPKQQVWIIPRHTMVFGDVNVWVLPKHAD